MVQKVVLVGTSTGGPNRVKKIVTSLPKLQKTAVIIAQHMSYDFLASFAKELNRRSNNEIIIPQNYTPINPGIYLCEAKTYQKGMKFYKDETIGFNPDINALFESFVDTQGLQILGAILTGIGDDGVYGCYKLHQQGATCLTETSESAIIDGMPARAREKGIRAYSFEEILQKILEFSE
ncbi:MAG: chemotaxis protein CheB [Epsilonproteobacteria bacterium]|nr:chemotaxis protein CheB [Campylobacterota bacterium]